MVSIQTTSAPPSRSPSICSAKMSTASSSVSGPRGAKRSPVGPTEPATTTGRPARVRDLARVPGGRGVDLPDAAIELVQREPASRFRRRSW